ncbi:hypothetical protein D3C81_861780 [compost metagenome]
MAADVARRDFEALVMRSQGEGLHLVEGDPSGHLRGNRRHRQHQRRAQEEDGQGVGRRHLGGRPAEAVGEVERQADGAQHHDVRPVAGQAVVAVGHGEVLAVPEGSGIEAFLVQPPRAVAVERQLLASVDHRLVALVELVLGLAQLPDVVVQPAHQQPAHRQGEAHPAEGGGKQRRRQPGQVAERGDTQHRAVDQVGQLHEGHGHAADVAGQAGEDLRPADGFDALDVGVQQALDHHPAQPVDEAVAQGGQRQLRAGRQRQ